MTKLEEILKGNPVKFQELHFEEYKSLKTSWSLDAEFIIDKDVPFADYFYPLELSPEEAIELGQFLLDWGNARKEG